MNNNYTDLDYVSNQYKMAKRHNNWERAYRLEKLMKKLQKQIYGCTWSVEQRRSVDGEKLVTIIIN